MIRLPRSRACTGSRQKRNSSQHRRLDHRRMELNRDVLPAIWDTVPGTILPKDIAVTSGRINRHQIGQDRDSTVKSQSGRDRLPRAERVAVTFGIGFFEVQRIMTDARRLPLVIRQFPVLPSRYRSGRFGHGDVVLIRNGGRGIRPGLERINVVRKQNRMSVFVLGLRPNVDRDFVDSFERRPDQDIPPRRRFRRLILVGLILVGWRKCNPGNLFRWLLMLCHLGVGSPLKWKSAPFRDRLSWRSCHALQGVGVPYQRAVRLRRVETRDSAPCPVCLGPATQCSRTWSDRRAGRTTRTGRTQST